MDTRIALVNDPMSLRARKQEANGSNRDSPAIVLSSIDSETLPAPIHRFDIRHRFVDPWSLPMLRLTKHARNGASQRVLEWFSCGRENCWNWARCVFRWPTIPTGSENNAKIRPSGLILRSLRVKRSRTMERGLNTAIERGVCLECEEKYRHFAVRRDIFR